MPLPEAAKYTNPSTTAFPWRFSCDCAATVSAMPNRRQRDGVNEDTAETSVLRGLARLNRLSLIWLTNSLRNGGNAILEIVFSFLVAPGHRAILTPVTSCKFKGKLRYTGFHLAYEDARTTCRLLAARGRRALSLAAPAPQVDPQTCSPGEPMSVKPTA